MNASLDGIIDRRNRDEKKFSGIWRDLAVRKRKTEVDAHFEPILSLAKRYGCQCRLTARMVEMIHEIEAGKRTFGQENLDELRRLVP